MIYWANLGPLGLKGKSLLPSVLQGELMRRGFKHGLGFHVRVSRLGEVFNAGPRVRNESQVWFMVANPGATFKVGFPITVVKLRWVLKGGFCTK